MNPNPDYDASDELEYGFAAFAWLLRGVYPPPAYAHRTWETPGSLSFECEPVETYAGGGT